MCHPKPTENSGPQGLIKGGVLLYRILYHVLRTSILFWLWSLGILLHLRLRVPVLAPAHGPAPSPALPALSVVLPVRDEARNVRDCLSSLLAQDYPHFEVIVLDDCSRDATASIAREVARFHPRAKVLCGAPPPMGWIGKSRANHQAQRHAHGTWLLFTDADVRLHPQTLSQAVTAAQDSGADTISVVQHLECRGFWERVLQPAFAQFILTVRPPLLVNSRWSRTAYATGQFILVRREAYDRSGGHAAVRDDIADDVALAGLLKRCGYALLLVDATKMVRVRMYHGLGEIRAGWRKSLYPASGNRPLLAAATLLTLFISSILPALTLLGWCVGLRARVVDVARTSALLMLATRIWGSRLLHTSPAYALGQPLAAAALSAVYVSSVVRHYAGGGQEWKGRSYPGGVGSARR